MLTQSLAVLAGALGAAASEFRLASSKDNWNVKNQPYTSQETDFVLSSNSSASTSSTAFDYDLLVCKDSFQLLSCSNTTTVDNLCCFENPGGLILQTQYWDYSPATGPSDSFTIHGLWPDNCDGTYEQYCIPDNEISNATQLLKDFGEYELLETMQTYWKDYEGDDASLWEHEFNKHGTCYSTINPECYGDDYEKNQEAIDYFKMTFNLFSKLPTYEWLQSEGIVPSNDTTYTKEQIQKALSKGFGFIPYFACDDNEALSEIWYYFYAFGSLRNQNFQAIDTVYTSTSCPDTGIKFPVKYSSSTSAASTKTGITTKRTQTPQHTYVTSTSTFVFTSSSTAQHAATSTKTITRGSTPTTTHITYTTSSVIPVHHTSYSTVVVSKTFTTGKGETTSTSSQRTRTKSSTETTGSSSISSYIDSTTTLTPESTTTLSSSVSSSVDISETSTSLSSEGSSAGSSISIELSELSEFSSEAPFESSSEALTDESSSETSSSATSSPETSSSETSSSETSSLSSSIAPVSSSTSLSCPLDLPFSCSNTTVIEDLCCFEYPGGAILSTQYWDYDPATGPADAFTLHGLWPDNCDGTYEQYCNSSLEITNPAEIVAQFNSELLDEMEIYWKDYNGDDESFWYHEYNKHGTCYSTINPSCYGGAINSTNREDVYDYYRVAMQLYETVPTYDWLVAEGIVPSENETYTYDQVMGALEKHFGYTPYIKCDSNSAISEVWYFHHLQGSLRDGIFQKIDTLTTPSCPTTGIRFPPKGSTISTSATTKTTTSSTATATSSDGSVKGYVYLTEQDGCLIKNGHWYIGGTCATYTLAPLSTGSYTLKSSAGYCTVEGDVFTCASTVTTPFEFNYDTATGLVSANGEEDWSATLTPSGTTQAEVSLGSDGSVTFSLQFTAI